jgi:hypothetical protein
MKMRTLLTILDSACRRLVLPAGAELLLVTGGCGLTPNEDEGDLVKPLAEYRVSISKSKVVLTKEKPEDKVTLSVTCVPLDGSLTCAINNPLWDSFRLALVRCSIDHNDWAICEATLGLDEDELARAAEKLEKGASSSVLGAQTTVLVSFFLKRFNERVRVTGRRWLEVQVPFGSSGDMRQDEAADKPVLTSLPSPFKMSAPGTGSVTRSLLIHYKGPPTYLLSVVLSGENSAKFRLGLPIMPFPMSKNVLFTIPVTFLGRTGPDDYTVYHADVTVIAENGTTEKVIITVGRSFAKARHELTPLKTAPP